MAIKVKVSRYSFDIREPEEKAKYEKIQEECKALGYKLFDVTDTTPWDKRVKEGEYEIELKHLFNNQYNTVAIDDDTPGKRVHDWYESINWEARHRKSGYYLTGDIAQLKAAKDNRLNCGYCGAQYDKGLTTHKLCTKCVGSEYLTEDNWPLLILIPVSEERDYEGCKACLSSSDLTKLREEFEAAKVERRRLLTARRLAKADQVLIDAAKKAESNLAEAHIKAVLLRLDLDIDDVIYYSHTKEWVWGWRKPVTGAERAAIMEVITANRDKLPPEFTGHLEFKMTGD